MPRTSCPPELKFCARAATYRAYHSSRIIFLTGFHKVLEAAIELFRIFVIEKVPHSREDQVHTVLNVVTNVSDSLDVMTFSL